MSLKHSAAAFFDAYQNTSDQRRALLRLSHNFADGKGAVAGPFTFTRLRFS